MPKSILLIPHYNRPDKLIESISSISEAETIDVLIVDDGSSKKPIEADVKKAFLANGKLIYIYLKQNQGIEQALNKGLEFCVSESYTYVARLDCGDLCLPNRFSIQENYLDTHLNTGLIGTQVRIFERGSKKKYIKRFPTESSIIKKMLFINAMLMHPSIMFRVSCLEKTGLYPTNYPAAEDLAFYFNFSKYYEIENLNDVLIEYELDSDSISTVKRKRQVASRIKLILDNFNFSFYPIYGLLRSILLYIMPLQMIKKIKFLINKNG